MLYTARAGSDSHAALWDQLRTLAWMPVHTLPPVAALPWSHLEGSPSGGGAMPAPGPARDRPALERPPLAAPASTRPSTDLWLASAGAITKKHQGRQDCLHRITVPLLTVPLDSTGSQSCEEVTDSSLLWQWVAKPMQQDKCELSVAAMWAAELNIADVANSDLTPALAARLGWNSPPAPATVTAQLLALGRLHRKVRTNS